MKKALLLALSAMAGGALAQAPGMEDPREPRAKAPGVAYRSAFDGYRPFRDQELAPWRAVNDEVAKVGGHIGVLKSADKKGGHR